jgi:hypothetical protein
LESKGFQVDLKKLDLNYYPKESNVNMIDGSDYNKVYVAIVFKINKNAVKVFNNVAVFGGVGYDIASNLPKEIDSCEPDYSLYLDNNISYGFLTRGCIRNCSFCVVPKKEGMIKQVATPKDIIRHKRVKFLDNNILAFKGHKELLKELVDLKVKCSFNQGLDIRLLNDDNAKLLSELNYFGEYVFAFDNLKDELLINKKLELFKKYISKDWKVKMFIYCHPDMNIKEDVVYRVEWCKANKVLPYLMRDSSCWKSENRDFYIDLCAYCNQPSIFKKMTFEEFIVKRTNNLERQKKSIDVFK